MSTKTASAEQKTVVSAPVEKENLSRAAMFAKLLGLKGAKFLTILIETEPQMNKFNREKGDKKKANPYLGIVKKRSMMNVTVNFDYETIVNKQRVREGNEADFQAEARKWGGKIPGTCLILKGNFTYLEFKPNGAPQFTEYFNTGTGEVIEEKSLEPFLPPKHSAAEHQGVEKEVVYRNVKLDNIIEIKFEKKHYKILG